ncbi:low affinity immunoglobulin epsilon Fc receptor-like [Saccostrea echinata]|uniref:low affinity immunoglobulin epsilon Fc receptor-like n=1 Tax=Saccostrea echinata TaxID=191078 RepID=UPI002A8277A7|nr:low affinity immunoglobulin epsilon Fc receptor-like [Saccostrea echinata]
MLFSCKLLNRHLNERSVNRTRVEVGWTFFNICPVGWVLFGGHCYFRSQTEDSWNNAQEDCLKYGAHLVEIDTPAENTWLMESFLPPWNDVACSTWHKCCSCWIGATDIDSEGVFTWNRRTNITFTNWYPNEPKNYLAEENCVVLCQNGLWNDEFCNSKFTFICKK